MTDTFEQSVIESCKKQHANWSALATLLVHKGVITKEELDQTIVRALAIVDQAYAEKVEEQQKELEKDPLYQLFRDMFGQDAEDLP